MFSNSLQTKEGVKCKYSQAFPLADLTNCQLFWDRIQVGMMKEEEDHYLYGREERDPRKRKRMSEEVLHSRSISSMKMIHCYLDNMKYSTVTFITYH